MNNENVKLNYRIVLLGIWLILPALLNGQQLQNYFTRGMQHYELEEYETAIDYFNEVLQFADPPRDAYSYLTSSYLLNGQPGNAVKIANQGLDEHPDFLQLRVMKGEAQIRMDPGKAILEFEKVYETIEASGEMQIEGINSSTVGSYLGQLYQQQGGMAFDEGDLARAADQYRRAREYTPDSLSVHNNLVYLYIQQEKWEAAEQAVEQGLEYFPGNDNLLFMKAQVLENRGDSDELLNALEQLYQSDPTNMERAVLYGKSLLNNNEARKANAFFQQKISEYPEERILYRTLIDINRQRFNQSGLLEVLELKLEQFPEDRSLLEEYGLELVTAREYEAARTFFDSLAMAYDSPEYGRTAARTYLYDENYDKAEGLYRDYLQTWPEESILTGDFAVVLKANGRHDPAKEMFETYFKSGENGWKRIQYASLMKEANTRKKALKSLEGTDYDGLASWLILKNPETGDIPDREALTDILLDMIHLYEKRQEQVTEEAQTGLSELRAPDPNLFQTATELETIHDELRELLNHIRVELSFEDALGVIDNASEVYENSATLHHHKGLLFYHDERNIQAAAENLEQAVRLNTGNEYSHLYLGHVYAKLDEFEKATLSYERVLTLNGENEEAYRSLIRISQKFGELDQLCDRWMQRFKHNKANEILKNYLVDALHRADRFDDASDLLSR